MSDLCKLSYRNQIVAQLQSPGQNKERNSVLKMLYFAVEKLHSNGVYIYPNIMEILKRNGFKSSALYIDAILYIIENISKEFKCNFSWINHRSFRKSNINDKNIILCFFLFTYRESFIKYLHDFLLQKEPNKEKIKNLILSLQRMIGNMPEINNDKKNIIPKMSLKEPSKNKSEKDNEPKNPKLKNQIFDFETDNEDVDNDLYFFNIDPKTNSIYH